MSSLYQRIWAHSEPCPNGCRVWTAATRNGNAPVLRWEGKIHQVRRLILEHAGVDLTGLVASTSCDTPGCVARKCVVAKTRKQASQVLVGRPIPLLRRLRLAEANRRNRKYSDEQIQLARTMPGSQRAVGEALGMPQSLVSKYRRTLARRFDDPMAQLLMAGGL